MKKYILFISATMVLFLPACRKNDNNDAPKVSREDISKAIDYTKDIYLWRTQLPASMNANQFNDLNELMDFIKGYSKEPGFNRNVDKWSFAISQTEWNDISQGIAKDFGLGIFFMSANDLRVKSVEKLSAAGIAGIKRGWQITKINNDINDINTSDATIDKIKKAVFESATVTITFKKPDGNSQEITLHATTYNETPIILDTVYSLSSGKVGYLVYNSFLGDSASVVTNMQNVFNKFSNAGISNMIVDMRYNGGGYVWMQELLANYLAATAANGQVMYSEHFNDLYANEFDTTVYFNKKGTLDLNKLYFITSDGTASASELLMNSLKPYLTGGFNVIGEPTEGKPVGFFGIPVNDWLIFPVSFRSLNKNNEGNYFDGFIPTISAADGLDRDWGDIRESCLAAALANINGTTKAFSSLSARKTNVATGSNISININSKLINPRMIPGAIENRRRLR